jgi:predicted metalloprotease with PDZ domain
MKYRISQQNPTSQFIQISLSLSCQADENIALQLPAWRSGRYEIANFAQYIRRLEVFANKRRVPCGKITKDLWTFSAKEETDY